MQTRDDEAWQEPPCATRPGPPGPAHEHIGDLSGEDQATAEDDKYRYPAVVVLARRGGSAPVRLRPVGCGYPGPPNRRAPHRDHDPPRHEERGLVWLELNKIGVWWCDWDVFEAVVEGAVGDVGGEGREGVLRGERAGVGDIVLGGVPYVFCGTQGRGRRGGM